MVTTHNVAVKSVGNRWVVPGAAVMAIAMLIAWFPVSTLIHQQAQLNAAKAQIGSIRQQEHNLATSAASLKSERAAMLQAREQYQLVLPGQSLIQVLPGKMSGHVSQSQGDPGLQPLAEPQSMTVATTTATASMAHSASNGFFARVLHTLEFWR